MEEVADVEEVAVVERVKLRVNVWTVCQDLKSG